MSRVGVSNLHYAKLLTDTAGNITYDNIVSVPGTVNIDITPQTDNATLYADDGPYETDSSTGKYEVSIELADLPTAVQADLLGHTISSNTDELITKTTDSAPYVAIMFESKKANGATRYVKLYKGKFAEPESNYQTKGESIEFQTSTITANFVALTGNHEIERKIDSDDTGSNVATTVAGWYTNVLSVTTPAVAGQNTYTVSTNFASSDTVAFGGVTLTAGTDFNVGAAAADSAGNLATALAANATIGGLYTVTASGAVITITEKAAGGGNTPGAMTVTGTGVVTAGTATNSAPAVYG